jgi:hypothetical protein
MLEHTIGGVLPAARIHWIYFENAPEKCEKNIRQRDDASVEHDLRVLAEFAPRYVIPSDITTLSVSETARALIDIATPANQDGPMIAGPRTGDDTAIYVAQARVGCFIVIAPAADNQRPDDRKPS